MPFPTHREMIEVGQHLGYKVSERGTCNGYEHMLNQALFQEGGLQTFGARLSNIKAYADGMKHGGDLSLTEEEKLDMSAFYSVLVVAHEPEKYPALFDHSKKRVHQGEVAAITSVSASKQMDEQGIRPRIICQQAHIFSIDELISHLTKLKTLLRNVMLPSNFINVRLGSDNHAISFHLGDDDKWLFSDINPMHQRPENGDAKSLFFPCETEQLAAAIFGAFSDNTEGYTAFRLEYNAVNEQHQEMIQNFERASAKAQQITDQRGQERCNARGSSLLYIAAKIGDTEQVSQLIEQGADMNRLCVHDNSPLVVAIANGHVKTALRLVIHGVEAKRVANIGDSPLSLALNTFMNSKNAYEKEQWLVLVCRLIACGASLQESWEGTPLLMLVMQQESDDLLISVLSSPHCDMKTLIQSKGVSSQSLLSLAQAPGQESKKRLIIDAILSKNESAQAKVVRDLGVGPGVKLLLVLEDYMHYPDALTSSANGIAFPVSQLKSRGTCFSLRSHPLNKVLAELSQTLCLTASIDNDGMLNIDTTSKKSILDNATAFFRFGTQPSHHGRADYEQIIGEQPDNSNCTLM